MHIYFCLGSIRSKNFHEEVVDGLNILELPASKDRTFVSKYHKNVQRANSLSLLNFEKLIQRKLRTTWPQREFGNHTTLFKSLLHTRKYEKLREQLANLKKIDDSIKDSYKEFTLWNFKFEVYWVGTVLLMNNRK